MKQHKLSLFTLSVIYTFTHFYYTVRDGDTVKHYRIRQADNGGFFIAKRVQFNLLSDLVEHYSADNDGLCVNLRKPCTQVNCYFLFYYSFSSLQYNLS